MQSTLTVIIERYRPKKVLKMIVSSFVHRFPSHVSVSRTSKLHESHTRYISRSFSHFQNGSPSKRSKSLKRVWQVRSAFPQMNRFIELKSIYYPFPYIFQQNSLFSSYNHRKSPYDILGVSISSSDKEIKLAYFRQAKKYHPDLNPNDPSAKAKFQEISAAYELLSDPTKRRMYDATGYSSDTHHQSAQSQAQYQHHAEEMFRTVQEDIEIVKDAARLYWEEMKDEMNYAVDCTMRRDWSGLWEVTKAHAPLVAGIVVPTALLLRYPPAVLAVLRLLFAGGQLAIAGLIYTGNVDVAVKMLWKALVNLSLKQKKRAEEKRRSS
jgi:hypothetical protein